MGKYPYVSSSVSQGYCYFPTRGSPSECLPCSLVSVWSRQTIPEKPGLVPTSAPPYLHVRPGPQLGLSPPLPPTLGTRGQFVH